MTGYRISASYEPEDAKDGADYLDTCIDDSGLDPTTTYAVEPYQPITVAELQTSILYRRLLYAAKYEIHDDTGTLCTVVAKACLDYARPTLNTIRRLWREAEAEWRAESR